MPKKEVVYAQLGQPGSEGKYNAVLNKQSFSTINEPSKERFVLSFRSCFGNI
jgi:hypothetical protein